MTSDQAEKQMNEHIKQLAIESKLIAPEYNGFDPTRLSIAQQKFAELIVRECVAICQQDIDGEDNIDARSGRQDCAVEIKEHFGVESTSIKVGSRVKVVSGFNVGAKGTVSYIEPTGRMWVMRDGASTDVFYHPEEVIGVEE